MTFPVCGKPKLRIRAVHLWPLLYILMALVLTSAAWGGPTTAWIGNPGDPELQIWYLQWIPFSISHGINPLNTDFALWPHGTNMMWNAAMILPSFILWPITALAGPIFSYNLLLTGGLALSGICMHLLLRSFLKKPLAIYLGALMFMLCPYITAHSSNHVNLMVAFYPPLLYLFLYKLCSGAVRPFKVGIYIGLASVGQFLLGEEVFVSTVLVAVLFLLVLAAVYRDKAKLFWKPFFVASAFAGGVFLLLCGVFLGYQLLGPHVPTGSLRPPGPYHIDGANFLVPTSNNLLAPSFLSGITSNFPTNLTEWDGYLGLPLLLIFFLLVRKNWSTWQIRVAVIGLLVPLLCSLGDFLYVNGFNTHIPLPGLLISHLPLVGNVLLNRLALYTDLFACVLFALWLEHSHLPKKSVAIYALLGGMTALLWLPAHKLAASSDNTPAFFSSQVTQIARDSPVAIFPFVHDIRDADVMLWQARAQMWFKMPEGYIVSDIKGPWSPTGPFDSPSVRFSDAVEQGGAVTCSPELKESLLSDFKSWHLKAVIVGPMQNRPKAVSILSCVLGNPPQEVGGVQLWKVDY